MVRGIPVGDALYLLRVRELRKIVNVRASGHDVFSVSLGQVAFKQTGLTNRYRIYNVLPKKWVDLLK
jgi:hypothetical protein